MRSSGHCSSVLAFWDWVLGTDHLPVPNGGSWERVLGWGAQYANLRNHRIGHHAFDWADRAVTSSIPYLTFGLDRKPNFFRLFLRKRLTTNLTVAFPLHLGWVTVMVWGTSLAFERPESYAVVPFTRLQMALFGRDGS